MAERISNIMKTWAFWSSWPRLLFILTAAISLSVERDVWADLTNGLAACWSFDGDLADHSGNGHDGIAHGTFFTADRLNLPGMACGFNGTTDYIDVTAPSSLQMTNEISIVAWINFSGGGPWNPRIVSYGGNFPSAYQGYELLTVGNGASRNLMFIFGDQSMTSSNSMPENTWQSVAAVASTNSLAIYIDGRLDSVFNATPGGFNYDDSPMGIGRKAPAGMSLGDDLWGGAIDELRIFNRALTAEQVRQLYVHEALPFLSIAGTTAPGRLRLEASNLTIGANYQVESSTDLNSWSDYGPPVSAAATTNSQDIQCGVSRGFWRLKALQ